MTLGLAYLAELLKKKKNAASRAGGSLGIFVIELNTFLNISWIYDTGCGTHICNTTQGLRASRKLKPGALSLYVGNGQREAVEAIGNFDLSLPSGLVIILTNCHYAPSITREYFSFPFVRKMVLLRFVKYNSSSIYTVSNKRAKLDLDSALLWHCRLRHISKKLIEKLQHDGLLNSPDLRAFEKCVPCMSGKMTRKPYTHQVKGPKTYLDLITPMGEYMSQEFLDHLKDHGIIAIIFLIHSTTQWCVREEKQNPVDMVRSYDEQTTLQSPLGLCLETAARIITYASESLEVLEIIQEEDTHPSIDTSLNHKEDDLEMDEPQSDIIPIRRSIRTRRPTDRMCLYIDAEEIMSDLSWTTVKNILKYLRKTKDMFLVYGDEICVRFEWSTYGLGNFISSLGVVPTIEKPINVYCDNTRAIAIANESRITKGARHFRAKVHYLRGVIEFGDIKLEKVHTDDNLADPFTKLLAVS
ncbi:zinc finger, CCHC-type containing protein [Tanacetum coccineum]|uniref:Zinc finger, CCHC-type containing protein n=1 Tax=Tanacetum coccineum TaxID=301880 RepID=A0ABQ5DV23_9ASTR